MENTPLLTTSGVFHNNSIHFYVLQEILQHGRSFEVEKILADERYQTLKVSRNEKKKKTAPVVRVLLGDSCENDLHSPSLKDTSLLKTLNANPF